MAIYEIVETPGRRIVTLAEKDVPHNQDEAKIVIERLRAKARKKGEQFDYFFRPLKDSNGSGKGGAQATSIRLTEVNRREIAKLCGTIMAETGDAVSMGDAVAHLARFARDNKEEFMSWLESGRGMEEEAATA